MTPDKTDQLRRMYDDMSERCEMVWMLHREDPGSDEPVSAVGAIILADDGNLMSLEASIDATGRGTVTVNLFDGDFEPIDANVMTIGSSAMIST